jgi:hypothetical protein
MRHKGERRNIPAGDVRGFVPEDEAKPQRMNHPGLAGKAGSQRLTVDLTMKSIAFALIVILACVGCARKRPEGKSLAIMELVREDGPEAVFLPNDYGFLIMWVNPAKPEFYLYDKPAAQIRMTNDFSAFLAGLAKFPKRAKVDRIRGCGISALMMPEEADRRLENLIRRKRFYMTDSDDGNFGVCSCDTLDVHIFTSADENCRVGLAPP